MLFMKGNPTEPRCGFSRQIVELLKSQKVVYDHFDILTDPAVRQGLKKFSNWPTYPQLYAKGKLVGGLDVVKELIEDEELLDMLPKIAVDNEDKKETLNERLKSLVNQKPVMVFMKGNPEDPKCGFSRKMVELLRGAGLKRFGHFDILEDQEVRQGLKEYS